jgi:hypothetical protein
MEIMMRCYSPATLFVLFLGSVFWDAAHAATDCDRACLQDRLDSYVRALVEHRPGSAPLAKSFRATENGAEVMVGEGLWRVAHSPSLRRYAIDAQTGNAVVQLFMPDPVSPSIVLLRVKVEHRRITEAEAVVAEKGKLPPRGVLSDFDAFPTETQPEWAAATPKDQQASRESLIAVAKSYFTALNSLASPQYKNALFADDCDRFENGMRVTNVPFMGRPATTCAAQFDGLASSLAKLGAGVKVDHERVAAVDEKNGIVALCGIMTPPPGPPGTPPSAKLLIGDLFKIVRGKLFRIQITYDNSSAADEGTGWRSDAQ